MEAWRNAADLPNWRWRATSGEEEVLPAGWLADLAGATNGRWVPVERSAAASGEDVLLLHQGSTRGRLVWMAAAVIACDAGGRCEQAALDAFTLRHLRDALKR